MGASPIGLQQLLEMQGLYWGRGTGQRHLWFDGDDLYHDGQFHSRGPIYDVRAYGAIPNAGSTVDQSAAFTAAINAASLGPRAETRGTLYVPAGKYYVKNLDLSGAPITIKGDANQGTFLYLFSDTADLLKATNSPVVSGIDILDIGFVGSGTGTPFTHYGLNFSGVQEWSLTRCTFDSFARGVFATGTSSIGQLTACIFGSNNTDGLYVDSADYTGIANCWFNENLTYGLYINSANCTVVGSRFSNNGTAHIYLDTLSLANVITGNIFEGSTTSYGIREKGTGNVIGPNSYSLAFTQYALDIEGTKAVVDVGFQQNDTGGHSVFCNGTSCSFHWPAAKVVNKSANYTATHRDGTIIASGSGTTITLPDATSVPGKRLTIKREDGTNNITVSRAGTDAIDAATTKTLGSNHAYIVIESDGAGNWYIVAQGGTIS